MTATQIIILSILFIFIMRNDILLITKYRYTFTEREHQRFFISGLFVILITFSSIFYLIEYNRLKKEMKCPEYEKVENVYKLKN